MPIGNRIVGHTIIVDSAMGNSLLLASAGMVIQMTALWVNAIGFFSTDTTGAMILTEVNTATQEIFRTAWTVQGAGTSLSPSLQFFSFNSPQRFTTVKIPTLTAGTGFIYLA